MIVENLEEKGVSVRRLSCSLTCKSGWIVRGGFLSPPPAGGGGFICVIIIKSGEGCQAEMGKLESRKPNFI